MSLPTFPLLRRVVRNALSSILGESGPPDAAISADDAITPLRSALESGRLVVITGAGLSAGSGLPMWGELIDRLTDKVLLGLNIRLSPASFKRYFTASGDLIKARYLRALTPVDGQFHRLVGEALLDEYDDNDLVANTSLSGVKELCLRSAVLGRRLRIITYNFDTLTEDYLSSASGGGLTVHVAYDGRTSAEATSAQIAISHVHGVLKKEDDKIISLGEIILTEDEFSLRMSDPLHWANVEQVRALQHDTCLFVGFSLTDPNMRRLLDLVKSSSFAGKHFVLMSNYKVGSWVGDEKIDTADDAEALNVLRAHLFKDLAVSTIYMNDYSQIESFLTQVARPA